MHTTLGFLDLPGRQGHCVAILWKPTAAEYAMLNYGKEKSRLEMRKGKKAAKRMGMTLFLVFGLASMHCETFRENPGLLPCKRICVEDQNLCMLQARTSANIDQCKETLARCILKCEEDFR